MDVERLGGAIARREMILDQAAPDHASVDLCARLDARFLSAATAATDPPGKPVRRKSVGSTYMGAAVRAAMVELSSSATSSAER